MFNDDWNSLHFTRFTEASAKIGPFLENLISYCYCKIVVEIGVAYATTTAYLCRGAQKNNGTVYGFDIWEQHGLFNQYRALGSKETSEEYLKDLNIYNFKLHKIDSKTNDLANILNTIDLIDFAFIDGCHSYEGTKNDFDNIYPRLSQTGMILFDDTLNIDGCREFMIDLKTVYFDGTYDIVDFPWKFHGGIRYGQSLLVKRTYPVLNIGIGEECGSLSSPQNILNKEKNWYNEQLRTYSTIQR